MNIITFIAKAWKASKQIQPFVECVYDEADTLSEEWEKCPECGEATFHLYVKTPDKDTFNPSVGKCFNHNCGYDYKPREYAKHLGNVMVSAMFELENCSNKALRDVFYGAFRGSKRMIDKKPL